MTLPLPALAHDNSNLQHILDLIAQAIPSGGVATAPRIVSGGKTNIATSQSTSATTYAITNLATQDTVTAVLPTDGLIAVWYQALWQNTVASNARAAVFVGANQLKRSTGAGAPVAQEATGAPEVNDDAVLATYPIGLDISSGVGAATEVTTGQAVASANNALGGPVYIFATAGTYAISVQFKNNAAGTLTVKNRHLWVAAYSFA